MDHAFELAKLRPFCAIGTGSVSLVWDLERRFLLELDLRNSSFRE